MSEQMTPTETPTPQCSCSVRERDSGHKSDCPLAGGIQTPPDWDAAIESCARQIWGTGIAEGICEREIKSILHENLDPLRDSAIQERMLEVVRLCEEYQNSDIEGMDPERLQHASDDCIMAICKLASDALPPSAGEGKPHA